MKRISKSIGALLLLAGPFIWAQTRLPYLENKTLTYAQIIETYQALDEIYSNAQLLEVGTTDSGRPLHLFLIQNQPFFGEQTLAQLRGDKLVILVNNGIHPGESCGIDASILWAQSMLEKGVPENQLIAIIPVYNVGGALNRGAYSRANQNGPQEHGFRGNAQNLDLNRDFVKAEALNTKSFFALFQALQPHIFVDTHTSNGANYQYTMTLISTQRDKLAAPLAKLLSEDLEPFLYQNMADKNWEMTPYVNVFGRPPNWGMQAFLETPRYASGYTALFNTLGFITETHMLKPYPDRVKSTLAFLETLTEYSSQQGEKIKQARAKAFALDATKKSFATQWVVDSTQKQMLDFKGYAYRYAQSPLGDYRVLRYDTTQPRTFPVDYYPNYKAKDSARVPKYFVLPQAYRQVVERLQYQNIEMERLPKDTVMEVLSTYCLEADFSTSPYEGKHPIKNLITEQKVQQRLFLKGDFLISTQQENIRFLMAVLAPTAVDSYLRWNFFDIIFQQKEHFSAYVFEETARALVAKDAALKKALEEWKAAHPQKATNTYAVLQFIYQHSPYYEQEHRRYPVVQIF